MPKARLEAFSDGVLAIIITVMVLELRIPSGAELAALKPVLPHFLTYLVSYVYVGIYWNNHHHMLHATRRINGRVLWANLHLLFWLSLVPAVTGWVGQNPRMALPTALYGVVLFGAAIAYTILERAIVACNGRDSMLAVAVGNDVKGLVSLILYLAGIGFAFVSHWIADALYVTVALIWLVPDPRIEKALSEESR